jgi:hypothetical protein
MTAFIIPLKRRLKIQNTAGALAQVIAVEALTAAAEEELEVFNNYINKRRYAELAYLFLY